MQILGVTANKIVQLAEQALGLLGERCDVINPGGYLIIRDGLGILFSCRVGNVTAGDADKLFDSSREGLERLLSNPLHDTSFQSRDPDNNKRGGAIRAFGLILSFYGISELDDEAVVLFIAYHANCWIKQSVALDLAANSKNDHLCAIL